MSTVPRNMLRQLQLAARRCSPPLCRMTQAGPSKFTTLWTARRELHSSGRKSPIWSVLHRIFVAEDTSFKASRYQTTRTGNRVRLLRLTEYRCWRLDNRIKLHFKDSQGNLLRSIEGQEGDNILDLAHEYDIDLEGLSLPILFLPYSSRSLHPYHFIGYAHSTSDTYWLTHRCLRRVRGMFDMPCYSEWRTLRYTPASRGRWEWYAWYGFRVNWYVRHLLFPTFSFSFIPSPFPSHIFSPPLFFTPHI